ncbi:putative Site-specific DNA-methyltransferase (Adenine-specific) [endosymbiont DhMRE of Dentiscutata heterogama]|uniref:N-6 DNA methylase n=1 Tax=endosymbiont DhMRE of Dentiscutata heterogama TaxID=1609546 RepID=UPI000636E27C|nr:N-6 DNA methylase [endosymbiont DhMRE of Dentiscutata heterogama]CFW92689.1 putative Site-specific DNA-methyltransferase (Adenine-specific) [endosymbiont DhMRE of Dentiscutata heterogama]
MNDFYNDLWKLLDNQRGSMDLHKYKEICFDLIFLLAVNRKFEQRKAELDPEDKEDSDYHELWLEKESRWDYISQHVDTNKLNQVIHDALLTIEKSNPDYKDLTHKDTFLSKNLDFQKLSTIFHDFDNAFAKKENNLQLDYLGNTYQFFLQQFAASSGRTGGEFYTPACVVQLLVNLLQPFPRPNYEIVIYDPCCGSGGMFVQSQEFITKNKKNNENGNLDAYQPLCLGQEIDDSTWKLARMNLLIHSLKFHLGLKAEDTFKEDLHPNKKADYIITNPPFNLANKHIKENDPRWKWGIPPKNDANFAWIEHCLSKLKEKGVAAIIMANGTLSGLNKKVASIRQNLIEDNLVEAIITLPNNLFYTTGIAPCVWILRKNRENESVLMIDISQDDFGEKISSSQRILTEKNIREVAELYHQFRDKKKLPKNGLLAKIVSQEEIKESNYILVPARYLSQSEIELTPKEIDEKLLKTTLKLRDLINQQDNYHQELKKLLEEVEGEIKER